MVFRYATLHGSDFIKRAQPVPDAQAAAAVLVAKQPGILDSAGNGPLVLCHLIADSDGVNKRANYE